MSLDLESRRSDSPFVERIWRSRSERPGCFVSIAATQWEMVVMTYRGKSILTVRGPETKASPADYPAGATWLGITFKLGSFMPELPPGGLLDRQDVNLPEATGQSFWLCDSAWEFPTFENADTFVSRLARGDLLVRDPVVEEVLADHPLDLSPRALQYRFQRATGLTRKAIRQIQRAQQAAALLEQGRPIVDTAYTLGYFDQSHLTNSLRRYLGQTPAQLTAHMASAQLAHTFPAPQLA
jgi:AraC-like DNA-binding protein